jgi:hypothetical protein
MDQIGVFTPEQARELWQDYQSRKQLPARVQQHYPQRPVVFPAEYTSWAGNIGSLAPATHPLTGHTTGVAAVLRVKDDGDLEITNDRRAFVRRDASGTIADGTLIQLSSVSGRLTIVWADCEPHPDLEGLDPTP